MPTVAVLFEPAASALASAGAFPVGGIGVLDRQVRQMRRAGVARVVVVGGRAPPGTIGVREVTAASFGPDDDVLMLVPGLVLDERIVRAVAASASPTIAVAPAGGPIAGVERIDIASVAAGIALYPAALMVEIAMGLNDWDLPATLLRAALAAHTMRLDLTTLPLYAPERRRSVPLVWALPATADEANAATGALLAAAQKGCLDWPARFLHPPIEDATVRLLLPTPVTPNMVTLVNVVAAIAAGIAFATGWLWTGLALALICGPLDGVDGKLARTRLEFSRFGELEHVLDKIAEYGWFVAIAAHFAAVSGSGGPYALAALLVGFALAESLQGEFFRRFTGNQLDDAGPFERRFRLIGARRNTLFWTWLPFAALGAWYAGFAAMAAYTTLTFFVMQIRFFTRLGAYGRENSTRIARNFADSTYELLASPAGNVQESVNG